eukprot:TRINITY_DN11917_c0_g1_i1.p1 TRINITY_DN11917_c0_g1~~TRINITY_DN11917_c0_g1_i1.p1  ORF type:complete len:86 (-),score=5.36 TRINITY_DN11917_c0_g1_i1:204-461(-)
MKIQLDFDLCTNLQRKSTHILSLRSCAGFKMFQYQDNLSVSYIQLRALAIARVNPENLETYVKYCTKLRTIVDARVAKWIPKTSI